jgi:uncharacterized protein (TIGR02145 family)
MNSLSNVFYFDKDGNLVQLDDILARQPETPETPVIQEPPTVTFGGKQYRITTIGNQTWLAENLAITWDSLIIDPTDPEYGYYKESDGHPGYKDDAYYKVTPTASYHNCDETDTAFGLYYNGAAIDYITEHKAELIPGWHVATHDEWETLFAEVGGMQVAGRKLKSTTMWPDVDTYGNLANGDGSTDFNALPHGYKDTDGIQQYSISEFAERPHAWFFAVDSSVESGEGRYYTQYTYRIFSGWSVEKGAMPSFCQMPIRLVKD